MEVEDTSEEPKEEVAEGEEAKAEEGEGEGGPKMIKVNASKTLTQQSHNLIQLEESILDEGGCWIFFNQELPKEEEEVPDPKKKKPAKGAAPSEDAKPTYSRGWLDLTGFKEPGQTNIEMRVFMETAEKKVPEKPEGEGDEPPAEVPVEGEGEGSDPPKIFEDAKTYVLVRVNLSEPVVPLPENDIRQSIPHELIPQKPVPPKIPPAETPEEDFKR